MSVDIIFDLYEAQEIGARVQVFTDRYDEGMEEEIDLNYYMSYGFKYPEIDVWVQASIFEPEDSREPIKVNVTSRRFHSQIINWLKRNNIKYAEV